MLRLALCRLSALCALSFLLNTVTVTASALAPRSTTVPAPLSIAPDQNWDGIDGAWSSFTLRVGTPEQIVRVFPSWLSYQTWVVAPQGCQASDNFGDCADSRGYIFYTNESSTWDYKGLYSLWIEQNLDYAGNAYFGFDTVGLGGIGEGGPTVKNMIVGQFAVEDFWLGVLGLNPKPTNWSSFLDSSPSYMTTLKEENLIPSVSFGYTAGAPYRYTGVGASLTLGGYDASKFEENDVEFTFAFDNERDLVIVIQAITTSSNTTAETIQLLPDPIYVLVDNTVPQIWLPLEACQAFEQEFGLIYDNTTELYLVNSTLHDTLLSRNASITFTLGTSTTGGNTVNITLPYASFDLTAQAPYQGLESSSTYFPLRRAANDTQYTLGRTFMQEAYITVDYERVRFNISQCVWPQNGPAQHLVAIPPANSSDSGSYSGNTATSSTSGSSSTWSPSSKTLSGGAIAGIAVGVAAVAIAAIVGAAIWWVRRRRRIAREKAESEQLATEKAAGAANSSGDGDSQTSNSNSATEKGTLVIPKAELQGSSSFTNLKGHYRPSSSAMHSPNTPGGYSTYDSSTGTYVFSPMSDASEAEGGLGAQIFEMPGDMPERREADGKQLTEKDMMQRRLEWYNGVDPSPPTTPADGEQKEVKARSMVQADQLQEVGRRKFSFEGDGEEGVGTHSTLGTSSRGEGESSTGGGSGTRRSSTLVGSPTETRARDSQVIEE